jgi:YbgC/YbaW family acyl-CoA thioester hydrolase
MSESNKFEYKFIVNKEMTDEYGHVNNARYLDLYEDARWNILEISGLGADMLKANRIGPVILEVNVRFRRELLPGDEITIITTSRRKNDLVFYFDQQMVNSKGEIASTAVFTAALFDLDTRKMKRADEHWLKAFGF